MCASGLRLTLPADRSGRARQAVAVLCLLWAVSATGRARETTSSQLLNTSALWEQGGIVADLDGDGKPDIAIVRAVGRELSAFNYRIEFALSTRPVPSSCNVSAEEGGLRIVPRDVDGDGNLDLVLTSARLYVPVEVLLNDGRGRFTRTDVTAYSWSAWTTGTGISSDAQREIFRASVPQSSRPWRALAWRSHFHLEVLCERLALSPATSAPLRSEANRPQTRAPPRSLNNPGNC